MTRLNVYQHADIATVSSTGPRGGVRWVADLTEGQLRRFALECEGQADLVMAHKGDSDRGLRCICIVGHPRAEGEHRAGRCTGQGTRINLGHCTGCRSAEFGTQGKPALVTHIPAKR